MLRKNIKDPKLCPVVTLMTWLAILRYSCVEKVIPLII